MLASFSTDTCSSTKSQCPSLAAWRAAHEQARRSWATIELSFDQFVAHLAQLGWQQMLPGYPDALYLSAACNLGLETACRALEHSYFPALKIALLRQREHWDVIEEVLQQTRERLLVGPRRRIASYRGDGPLQAWLTVVARRVAQDLHRGDSQRRRLISWESQYCSGGAAEPDTTCQGYGGRALDGKWLAQVEETIRAALDSLHDEDRRLLQLHYIEHRNACQIRRALGVNRATVYRRLRRVEQQLARVVRHSIQARCVGWDRELLDELLDATYASVSLDDYFASASPEALRGPFLRKTVSTALPSSESARSQLL